jgi:hypothetical protein
MKDIDNGIFTSLKKLKNVTIEVGIFSDSTNNTGKKATYVADYAIANEFGTSKIPERSFVRSTADSESGKWQQSLDKIADQVITNQANNTEKAIYEAGQLVRSDIIKKIDSNIAPTNAPATSKKKLKQGKTKTLIDTGILRNSIEARYKYV